MKEVYIKNISRVDQPMSSHRGLNTIRDIYAYGEYLEVSDGYHTMDELYDHRITLYIALCKLYQEFYRMQEGEFGSGKRLNYSWRSKRHSDGELCFDTGTQYVLGIGKEPGTMITYHIPIERWNETDFAETLDKSPEWDGHTSADVLERLKTL